MDGRPGAGGYRQPVSPVDYNGVQYMIGQANNALIFPGLGPGVIAARATRVTDGMLAAMARARLDGDVCAAVRHLLWEAGYRPVRPG